jgi:hypothetical protein
MKRRLPAVVAWTIWAIPAAIGGLGFFLLLRIHALTVGFVSLPVAFAMFPTVGALIVSRQPRNTIGWIFMGVGVGTAITFLDAANLQYEVTLFRHALPVGVLLDWAGNCIWPINVGLGSFLLLLFPTGHLLSRRWRWVAWLDATAITCWAIASAFMPGPFGGETITNPFGIAAARGVLEPVGAISSMAFDALVLLAVVSAILRFRRSRGEAREQMKWFAYGAALLVVCIVSSLMLTDQGSVFGNLGFAAGFAMLPIGAGIAILRYRLYDIDIIIRRTLIYAALTAILAVIYFAVVIGAQSVIQALTGQRGQQPVIIVATTLLIAALFNPLRRRLQTAIDHRFYRRRYDAAKTLAAFGATLRTETDLDQLSEHLLAVVQQTMQPASVSLWLRAPRHSEQRAASPPRMGTYK